MISVWLSSRRITVEVEVDRGQIVYAPPVARRFERGQLGDLLRWAGAQGGLRIVPRGAIVVNASDIGLLKSADSWRRYIGRGGSGFDGGLGNPIRVSECYNRAHCITRFREHFHMRLAIDPAYRKLVEQCRNKLLVCFCAPLPCHGDVIAEYVNRPYRRPLPRIQ